MYGLLKKIYIVWNKVKIYTYIILFTFFFSNFTKSKSTVAMQLHHVPVKLGILFGVDISNYKMKIKMNQDSVSFMSIVENTFQF